MLLPSDSYKKLLREVKVCFHTRGGQKKGELSLWIPRLKGELPTQTCERAFVTFRQAYGYYTATSVQLL